MEKKKFNYLLVIIICGALTVLGAVANILALFNENNDFIIRDIVDLILLVLIVCYAFYGYRKPHGNLLKYVILIYAASFLIKIYTVAITGAEWPSVLDACTIGICCYIAGRLHKVKQNTILMCIATAIIVVKLVYCIMVVDVGIGIFSNLVLWIDICAAYLLRYKEHKESGSLEPPKA